MSKYSKLQGHLTNYNIPTNIIALIKGNLVTNLYKAVNDICGFVFRQFKDADTNLLTTTLVKKLQAEGIEVSSVSFYLFIFFSFLIVLLLIENC